MPIYSYRCERCGECFDMRVKLKTDEPHCPICNGKAKKIFTPISVHFHGKGFYVNEKGK